jgi:lactosylceramide 4-alpha-galactosyltransferase
LSNRSLDALGSNYAERESASVAANGVVNFAWDGIGHRVADRCLEELRSNFRGDIWGYNGPMLITRVLNRMCNFSQVNQRAVGETWSLATTIYSYMTS